MISRGIGRRFMLVLILVLGCQSLISAQPNAFGYDMIWEEILSSTDIMGNLWG